MKNLMLLLIIFTLFSCIKQPEIITIHPEEYIKPIRNPHKGFEVGPWYGPRTVDEIKILGSVTRARNGWSDWEVKQSDDVNIIRERFEKRFGHLSPLNHSVTIRISVDRRGLYPNLNEENCFLPDDLSLDDYLNQTPYFRQRCVELIEKVAKVIDGDPRVDRFELGFVGKWGESHNPHPTLETQEALGNACAKYFHKTPVTYRNHNQYKDFKTFGLHNDALVTGGCGVSMERIVNNTPSLKEIWKNHPVAGEIAYGLPCSFPQLEDLDKIAKNDSLVNWMINVSRYSHVLNLMRVFYTDSCWLLSDRALENFYAMHKAIGYRYVIDEFSSPDYITPNDSFSIRFKVRNTGSSPVYYDYPVVLGLLDTHTKEPVWIQEFSKINIKEWIGGEGFPFDPTDCHENFMDSIIHYITPPPVYNITQNFILPDSIQNGQYYLALAIFDHATRQKPAIRFATENYFKGGWHPMAFIGVNDIPKKHQIDPELFDDILEDLLLNSGN